MEHRAGGGTLTPGGPWKHFNPPISIIVTGIPYWDTNHGQPGQGPNYLELHPVLSISFPVNCALPATRAVNVCLPVANSMLPAPVRVVASAKGTAVTGLTVWLDGVPVHSVKTTTVDVKLPINTAGKHRITVTARDSGGDYWKTVNFTVQ